MSKSLASRILNRARIQNSKLPVRCYVNGHFCFEKFFEIDHIEETIHAKIPGTTGGPVNCDMMIMDDVSISDAMRQEMDKLRDSTKRKPESIRSDWTLIEDETHRTGPFY
jgi:hypothetical protein